jgi:exodeoxyribonuclease-5
MEYVAEGENCKLLLIGDNAQLPPVGMELSPALDLQFLKSRYGSRIYHFELTEVMRQSLESGILSNATRLRDFMGEEMAPDPLFNINGAPDVEKIDGSDLEDRLNTAYSSSDPGETIVICRSNKRANMYNRSIRERILFMDNEISSGDSLMIVKNNYFWLDPDSGPGFLANGDIIEVMRIKGTEELYSFRFADVTIRLMDYPDEPTLDVKIMLDTLMADAPALPESDQKRLFSAVMEDYQDIPQRTARLEKVRTNPYYNALQVKFAYALTCHKTQGGQWSNVFIDQGFIKKDEIGLEHLRWLYTAFTRAVNKVGLINFPESLF